MITYFNLSSPNQTQIKQTFTMMNKSKFVKTVNCANTKMDTYVLINYFI